MIEINLDEDRKFYQQYKCEVLTTSPENKELLDDFKANSIGSSLEHYLKELAWEEDSDGETKIYLVKGMNNKVALYFSIKCGLLYEPHNYFSLEDDEQEFVNMLMDAIKEDDRESIDSYYESGYYTHEKTDELYKIALERVEEKKEGQELGDVDSALKVHKCYSAIELRHFCKNVNNEIEKRNIPIGVGLFWEVIVPQICKITELIGCKYLYLFAADQTDEQQKVRKLIQYYKTDLKFEDVQNLTIIKPDYDRSCWGLVQAISDLKKNRDIIWEEFSDVYE